MVRVNVSYARLRAIVRVNVSNARLRATVGEGVRVNVVNVRDGENGGVRVSVVNVRSWPMGRPLSLPVSLLASSSCSRD